MGNIQTKNVKSGKKYRVGSRVVTAETKATICKCNGGRPKPDEVCFKILGGPRYHSGPNDRLFEE